MGLYEDRAEAGQLLALVLRERGYARPDRGDLLILAIPRGGVVVGAEIAKSLDAPLDVWIARKIGAPGNPELAIGSVASHGELLLDHHAIDVLEVSPAYIQEAVRREREELDRRLIAFRGSAEPVKVEGRTVVLVDDGVATGATVFSALAALHRGGALKRILAVPVAPRELVPELRNAADELVLLSAEPHFYAVGQFYRRFGQVSEEEAIRILTKFPH